MTPDTSEIEAEISRLHDFFTNWIAALMPNDDALFEEAFEHRLAVEFVNIQPAGTMLDRDILLQQVKAAYGKNPAFRIKVGKVRIHQQLPGGILLVTYEEYQQGAKNSASENARLATALLRKVDGKFQWLWVHETALSDGNIKPEISAV